MEEKELLPCPWCASKPHLLCEAHADDKYWICCDEDDCPVDPRTSLFDTPELTIAAWNTRADRQTTQTIIPGATPPVTMNIPTFKSDLLDRLKNPDYAAGYLRAAIGEGKDVFELACKDVLEAMWEK